MLILFIWDLGEEYCKFYDMPYVPRIGDSFNFGDDEGEDLYCEASNFMYLVEGFASLEEPTMVVWLKHDYDSDESLKSPLQKRGWVHPSSLIQPS